MKTGFAPVLVDPAPYDGRLAGTDLLTRLLLRALEVVDAGYIAEVITAVSLLSMLVAIMIVRYRIRWS